MIFSDFAKAQGWSRENGAALPSPHSALAMATLKEFGEREPTTINGQRTDIGHIA